MLTKNISDMIYSIKFSKPFQVSLAYIINQDIELGKKIFNQLKDRLPYDPYPEIDDEQDLFRSVIVRSLEKRGMEVYRLKSRDFHNYRVFYIVDDDEYKIYVLEVVPRSAKTYIIATPHMKTIKDLYIQYYTYKQRKRRNNE